MDGLDGTSLSFNKSREPLPQFLEQTIKWSEHMIRSANENHGVRVLDQIYQDISSTLTR